VGEGRANLSTGTGLMLYERSGAALVRAAALRWEELPQEWPDLTEPEVCRAWLAEVWSHEYFAEAVRLASPVLAARCDALQSGCEVKPKEIRNVVLSIARYLLRASSRATPFGLFAGIAPVRFGFSPSWVWGAQHRRSIGADSEWLADLRARLEGNAELLRRVDVVFNNLAVARGDRLEIPLRVGRARIRYSDPVRLVRLSATEPVGVERLISLLTSEFADICTRARAEKLVTELVRQGFLISSMRAPSTVADPVRYLAAQLRKAGVGPSDLPDVNALLETLDTICTQIKEHNSLSDPEDQDRRREAIVRRMSTVVSSARSAVTVELHLGCVATLPVAVADEMERAATALICLSRRPAGEPDWFDYHRAFCEMFGTGTAVPVLDVVDSDRGLGYPAGFRGSRRARQPDVTTPHDERLLHLAWAAIAECHREVVLTDEEIRSMIDGTEFSGTDIPPHLELAARIYAPDTDALRRGDFLVGIAPARSIGTLTGRFSRALGAADYGAHVRTLRTITENADQVQLTFDPETSHALNVCRTPLHLATRISLAEFPESADNEVRLTDIAVTATRTRLYLVRTSTGHVLEPQVFHALALDTLAPPLARFLVDLPRAFAASLYAFDWGNPARGLPYLPRVRVGRAVLTPARWVLTREDLEASAGSDAVRSSMLDAWRRRWACPQTVELRDIDRTLLLNLSEPVHVELLRLHVEKHGRAMVVETFEEAGGSGWTGGRAHEVAVPFVARTPRSSNPIRHALAAVDNRVGQMPASRSSRWLFVKLFVNAERQNEVLTQRLGVLSPAGDPGVWFVRYRSSVEDDHLRIRIGCADSGFAEALDRVGQWIDGLQHHGLAGRVSIDTYYPEIGRYGGPDAIEQAESAFVADSGFAVAVLQSMPSVDIHAAAAASMVHIAQGFLGDRAGIEWLIDRRSTSTQRCCRETTRQAAGLVSELDVVSGGQWPDRVCARREARDKALAGYRQVVASSVDIDGILGSLMHMHFNRLVGIDNDAEAACRRLARQLAIGLRARGGDSHA
jgi:lantibiotic biosynthesis protein